MTNCLICKKYPNVKHPSQFCIMFHGQSGLGGRIAQSKIPLEYRFTTIEDVPFLKEVFEAYVSTFDRIHDSNERVKSLYLWSKQTGTGKTTTATALANEFQLAHVIGAYKRGIKPEDFSVFYLDVNELQDLYNQHTRPNVDQEDAQHASREYRRRIDLAKKAPFVVFDDIGVREATEAFRGDLHTIINHRYVQQLTNIYTSNLPLESIKHVYDNRIYDRIRHMTKEIEFTGTSLRG